MVLVETVGAGQGDTAVRDLADVLVLLLQPETGDDLQWEKAGLLEVADVVAIHKADLPGAERVEAQVLAALALSPGRGAAGAARQRRTGAGVEALWTAIAACPLRRAARDAGAELLRLAQETLAARFAAARADGDGACRTCSSAGAAASWTRRRRSRRCCTCWGIAREGGNPSRRSEVYRATTLPDWSWHDEETRHDSPIPRLDGLHVPGERRPSSDRLRPPPARASGPPRRTTRAYEVEATKDVTYRDGDDADKDKHKLDLYLPNGKKDFPVVMFVHGGAWVFGDRNFFGVYEGIGKMFARHGIGAVVISYRLSPHVKHPEHVKDVAAAFAWTHKHIGEYGGRADELFLCGHSAGGHLVSLLATDESYLQAEGLSLKDVKGVMPISGVYGIPDKMFNEVFGKDRRRQAGRPAQPRPRGLSAVFHRLWGSGLSILRRGVGGFQQGESRRRRFPPRR